MRILSSLLLLALLASCTPRDVAYCQRQGVAPGHAEYDNCLTYFAQNQSAFDRDYAVCLNKARQVYPDYLYDYSPRFHYGFGIGHGFYPYHHPSVLWYDDNDDYWRNAQLDNLRGTIISPCMQERGWNDPKSWEAGRHNNKVKRKK